MDQWGCSKTIEGIFKKNIVIKIGGTYIETNVDYLVLSNRR